jgi:hypothetical protein
MIIQDQLAVARGLKLTLERSIENQHPPITYSAEVKERFADIGILLPTQLITSEKRLLRVLISRIQELGVLNALLEKVENDHKQAVKYSSKAG